VNVGTADSDFDIVRNGTGFVEELDAVLRFLDSAVALPVSSNQIFAAVVEIMRIRVDGSQSKDVAIGVSLVSGLS